MRLVASLHTISHVSLCCFYTDVGVIGSCTELCGMLPGSNVEKEVCEVLCGVAGFYEFVKIIEA